MSASIPLAPDDIVCRTRAFANDLRAGQPMNPGMTAGLADILDGLADEITALRHNDRHIRALTSGPTIPPLAGS